MQLKEALKLLRKNRVVAIYGRSGVGKSHFALTLGEKAGKQINAKVAGVTGDQFRQHASFHPFEQQNYLDSLRKSKDEILQFGSVALGAVVPCSKIFYSFYKLIKKLFVSQRTASTGFTQEEIEGARSFATKSSEERIFIFDNFHFWDSKSLDFARKIILTRNKMKTYIIIVWTEYDVIQSVNSYHSVIEGFLFDLKFHFKGLPDNELQRLFLNDLSSDHAATILDCAGANIPLIKRLAQLAKDHTNNSGINDILSNAAVEIKVESLFAVSEIAQEQRALGSLATLGSGTPLRDIACSLDLSVDEVCPILEWGIQHDLINVLDSHQVVFIHDLYQRLFDTPAILTPKFLHRINLCCSLGLPDEYEKRLAISCRGSNRDYTLSLAISFIRQHILSWNEGKSDIKCELNRIHQVMKGKYALEIQNLYTVISEILRHASNGRYAEAASIVSFTNIATSPEIYVEEVVVFSHYAYMSRDNSLRLSAIEKLMSVREVAQKEAERSFIVSTMLTYGLSLENRLKEATAVLAEEESRLISSADRFHEAFYYIAICERISLSCYGNDLARLRLERSFSSLESKFYEDGYLKRPDEIIKCATNLCSAYIIGNSVERAHKVINSAQAISQTIDFSWSTAPSFLLNNEMVVNIHMGKADYEKYANSWMLLAGRNIHAKLFFLINALACFLETESCQLGSLSINKVIEKILFSLADSKDLESFIAYMAHVTIWQTLICLNLEGNKHLHLKEATKFVSEIPYVNGDYFRVRHDALVESAKKLKEVHMIKWQKAAFDKIPIHTLPYFYRRIAHFNPIEHWLPY
ncbi:hypothetical protein [Maridesulfovibrio sp.]|uniref:hypothetical protein n=1 Tax=Maridesulfovibrio sp. TaxID=2795000 RepID=UPI002AA7B48E|nr:hypothetical protein [Maridesulfovibrio sp.]